MSTTLPKYLEVSIFTLKDDRTIDNDSEKKINASDIKSFDISFNTYGFNGEITFHLPYNRSEEPLWDKLIEEDFFAIKLKYYQEIIKDNKYEIDKEFQWQILGYFDTSEHGHCQLVERFEPSSSYLEVSVKFTDSIKAFFGNHYIQKVFFQKSYQQILKDMLKDFSKIFELKLEEPLSPEIKENRPWLAVNCDKSCQWSFYKYIMNTFQYYHLQPYYIYNNEDSENYNVKSLDEFKQDCDNKDAYEIDRVNVDSIYFNRNSSNLACYTINNSFWDKSKQSADSKDLEFKNSKDSPIKVQENYQYANGKDFDAFVKKYEKNIELNSKTGMSYKLYFRTHLTEINFLPMNIISLKDGNKNDAKNIDEYQYPDYFILKTHLKYVNSQVENKNVYIKNNNKSLGKDDKDLHKDYFRLTGDFCISVEAHDKKNIARYYPVFNKENPAIKSYGEIFGTDDDKKLDYFLGTENKDEIKRSKINDSLAKSVGINTMSPLTSTSLYYLVTIPESLSPKTKEKQRKISVPFSFNNGYGFMPLKNKTPVKLNIFQEHSNIEDVVWIPVTESKNFETTDGESRNTIFMGMDDKSYTKMEHLSCEEKDKSEFFIESKNKNIKTKLNFDAQSFNITISNAEK
ncbi:hypothetical protein IB642_01245 [Allofrancisella guangzhouensis]|uniref:Uncharacterized protein n=1 Tax=Allofrancisella guangzhouensis TaxID=594679 RepID=A0A0A8E5Y2_9GAMM|nr:hypothetical protein [Allofrancisella guangzhouensis]AJC49428.1 hypothetical protein SD28_07260 [Allofrancisella guangzhouensis]MBK2026719.1 hypothetical protein [Allofrancisella guangzhouensis]MBK2043644.1 hypothetical protein [Allofrancisella guangzhouensis]MBK2046201.1 hypothetical protein [Allofrancisella guangzhouensis]